MHVEAVCAVEGVNIGSNVSNAFLKRGFLGFGKVWWATFLTGVSQVER